MALMERGVVEQRYEAVQQVLREGVPVTEVAERFGVSRQSVHAWIRWYETDGVVALTDRITLHLPTRWPWADDWLFALHRIRALPNLC